MGDIQVHDESYGVRIEDAEMFEAIAVETEDIPGLIRDLQARLPMEYNTIVTHGPDGVIYHTYNPLCPDGCGGQMDDCVYKKEIKDEPRSSDGG